jgi:uncharacterized small protein (DUF1192 family)
VGIGRTNVIGSEYFGIQAPVSGANYGGMYINTASSTGRPFYDTAPNGMKRLSIHGFEALTVEALRDLRKENNQRVATLKAENARMQSELAKQKANTARLEARLSAPEKILLKFAGTEQPSAAGPLFSSDAQ